MRSEPANSGPRMPRSGFRIAVFHPFTPRMPCYGGHFE